MFEKIFKRKKKPIPFTDSGDLCWNDPDIGRWILKEHLDSSHDGASRPRNLIMRECAFIDRTIIEEIGRTGRVLDFTCGPGLYSLELTRLGHKVTGVDFNGASIDYARQVAKDSDLNIEYICSDVREVSFKAKSFDAVLFLYGQPNAFTNDDLRQLLAKLHSWTTRKAILVLDLCPIWEMKTEVGQSWKALPESVFSDRPHLWLEENFWHAPTNTQAQMFYIVDAETGETKQYSVSHTGYSHDEIKRLLEDAGWQLSNTFGDLLGSDFRENRSRWMTIVAQRLK